MQYDGYRRYIVIIPLIAQPSLLNIQRGALGDGQRNAIVNFELHLLFLINRLLSLVPLVRMRIHLNESYTIEKNNNNFVFVTALPLDWSISKR